MYICISINLSIYLSIYQFITRIVRNLLIVLLLFEKNSSSKSEISSGCSRADNSYNYEMQLKDHSDNDHDNVMAIVMMSRAVATVTLMRTSLY